MFTTNLTRISTLAAAIGLALSSGTALSVDTNVATQSVTYEVEEIGLLSIAGTPAAMTISAASAAGQQPTPVTDSSTTYSLTSNDSLKNHKITASINSDMPTGVTLEVELEAPTGATSAGKKALAQTAADVVTGITPVIATGKTITYTLSATVAAGIVTSANKTVTFTLTDA